MTVVAWLFAFVAALLSPGPSGHPLQATAARVPSQDPGGGSPGVTDPGTAP
jgi:hypothetical protein